jgi:hypothetical protein
MLDRLDLFARRVPQQHFAHVIGKRKVSVSTPDFLFPAEGKIHHDAITDAIIHILRGSRALHQLFLRVFPGRES